MRGWGGGGGIACHHRFGCEASGAGPPSLRAEVQRPGDMRRCPGGGGGSHPHVSKHRWCPPPPPPPPPHGTHMGHVSDSPAPRGSRALPHPFQAGPIPSVPGGVGRGAERERRRRCKTKHRHFSRLHCPQPSTGRRLPIARQRSAVQHCRLEGHVPATSAAAARPHTPPPPGHRIPHTLSTPPSCNPSNTLRNPPPPAAPHGRAPPPGCRTPADGGAHAHNTTTQRIGGQARAVPHGPPCPWARKPPPQAPPKEAPYLYHAPTPPGPSYPTPAAPPPPPPAGRLS